MDIETCKNLQKLIDSNNNIELIEIWSKVLYLRMKVGRNKFHSKKGITNLVSGIYINLVNFKNEYKQLQFKFHPDRNAKYLEISKGINQWKAFFSECNQREFNRTEYNCFITSYSLNTSIFTLKQPISFRVEQEARFFHGFATDKEWFEYRVKAEAREEEWLARRCGRNKDGSKYVDPNEGSVPF